MKLLKIGDIKYLVGYVDKDLSVPFVQTLMLKKIAMTDLGEEIHIFENLDDSSEPTVKIFSLNIEECLFDEKSLIKELSDCFERKQQTPKDIHL